MTQKESVALSGEVYHLYIERFQDNPGTPGAWAAVKAFNRAATEGRLLTGPRLEDERPYEAELAEQIFGANLTTGINSLSQSRSDAALEQRYGWLADWVLTQHGLNVDIESRRRLLQDVGRAVTDAAWQLKRNAAGDYTPDPAANRFPTFQRSTQISVSELFERWKLERKPSASTISTWSGYVRSLEQHVSQKSVGSIGDRDIIAWKDKLVAQGLSQKTINGGYLAVAHTLFAFAVSNRLTTANPAIGVKAVGAAQAGTSMLAYDDIEVARLLEVSKSASAERRWLIWLAATSGARIGELAQLTVERVVCIKGISAIHILPAEDGGSLKNTGSEQTIPLHPAVIESGFLDFVKSKRQGPLFYGTKSRKEARLARSVSTTGRKHPSKGVTNHLATWIRGRGFTDARKAPNHALRHWWKTAASRAGIPDSLADAIQGHAPRSVAGNYRHFDLVDFADAIPKIKMPGLRPKAAG